MVTGPSKTGKPRPCAKRPPAGPVVIPLEPAMDYAAAGRMLDALRAARDGREVVLDAGGVERMSTASVLVLLSLLRSREGSEPPAVVLNASAAFIDAFSELGIFQPLMRMEFRT